MAEHPAVNRRVVGSSPTRGAAPQVWDTTEPKVGTIVPSVTRDENAPSGWRGLRCAVASRVRVARVARRSRPKSIALATPQQAEKDLVCRYSAGLARCLSGNQPKGKVRRRAVKRRGAREGVAARGDKRQAKRLVAGGDLAIALAAARVLVARYGGWVRLGLDCGCRWSCDGARWSDARCTC